MTASVHIVLETVEIIAMDLVLCITDYDPSATVLVARSPANALELLRNRPSIKTALIHSDPAEFADSQLGRELAARGAQCVFMGDRAERSKAAVCVLERPFSSETILTLMQRLYSRTAA